MLHTLQLALHWFASLASAVAQAHSKGLVHGQIRPEHLLLHRGEAKLLGFSQVNWRYLKRGRPTTAGHCRLRPRDASDRDAPELRGRDEAKPSELEAADVWALGVLFIAMLTGEPLQMVAGAGEPTAQCDATAPPATFHLPAKFKLHAPECVTALIQSMLAISPGERPFMDTIATQAGALLMPLPGRVPPEMTKELEEVEEAPGVIEADGEVEVVEIISGLALCEVEGSGVEAVRVEAVREEAVRAEAVRAETVQEETVQEASEEGATQGEPVIKAQLTPPMPSKKLNVTCKKRSAARRPSEEWVLRLRGTRLNYSSAADALLAPLVTAVPYTL